MSVKYNNEIADPTVVDVSATEWVSLTEVKAQLNLVFESTGSSDFADDDAFITALIPVARMWAEKVTGLSLIKKTITAYLRNEKGCIEIPYGPFLSLTSITDYNGDAVDSADYKLLGGPFKILEKPCYDYLEVTYDAGYDPEDTNAQLPGPIKQAIIQRAAYLYKHRGDEGADQKPDYDTLLLLKPYRRRSWLL